MDADFWQAGAVSAERTGGSIEQPVRPNIGTVNDTEVEREMDGDADSERESEQAEEPEEVDYGSKRPLVARSPQSPTKQEREEHNVSHLPFRSWCEHCVKGKSKEDAHRRKERRGEKEEDHMPSISMDYCFYSQGGTGNAQGNEEPSGSTVLVIRDRDTKSTYSHMVHAKGPGNGWIVDRIVEDIEGLGHTDIILKTDGEAAIKSLQAEVKQRRSPYKTVLEHAPKGSSSSNGIAEKAVQEVQGQVRTMKSALASRVGYVPSDTSPVMAWMTEAAGQLITRYQVGHDGKTAYERSHGRRAGRPMAEFGEKVWYKVARDKAAAKLAPRWNQGIFFLRRERSDEAVIGTRDGVLKTRSIKRMIAQERWDADMIKTLRGYPWRPDGGDEEENTEVVAQELPEKPHIQIEEEPQVRRVYIKKGDVAKYGASVGCPGCRAVLTRGPSKPHTEPCRARITRRMMEEEEGRMRLEEAEKRQEAAHHRNEAREEQSGGVVDEPPRKKHMATGDAPAPAGVTSSTFASSTSSSSSSSSSSSTSAVTHGVKRKEEDVNEDGTKRRHIEDKRTSVKRKADADPIEALTDERPDVMELFSVPRLCPRAEQFGLRAGPSYDIRGVHPHDLRDPSVRRKVRQDVEQMQPFFVIGSPPCTMMSTLQALNPNKGSEDWMRKYWEAVMFLAFCGEIYEAQVKGGRYFIHEHPAGATSWGLDPIMRIAATHGVISVRTDQCMFGLVTWDQCGEQAPAQKPTKFLTNSCEVAQRLSVRCDGCHGHVRLLGGRAGPAQEYPAKLCDSILEGIAAEKHNRELGVCMIGAVVENAVGQKNQVQDEKPFEGEYESDREWMECWDEITGKELDPKLVKEARREELKYLKDMKVYNLVPRRQALQRTRRAPIRVKWVDINKGDAEDPCYRSRLVAAEINTHAQAGIYAGTPPIEAMRHVISKAATGVNRLSKRLMVIDVKRAYFFAKATRECRGAARGDQHGVGRAHVLAPQPLHVRYSGCRTQLVRREQQHIGVIRFCAGGQQPMLVPSPGTGHVVGHSW